MAQDTTVQQNGGVYFTDKQNVYYYMDDCTPSDAQCVRSAAPLLAASLQALFSSPLGSLCDSPLGTPL